MPRVLDVQRRYMELGRIRMGEKGSKGQPTRLDTWRLTSASKDLLTSAAAAYGGTVQEWTDAPDKGYWQLTTETDVLDVIVPPGDPYSQFYEQWSGGGCKRRCNGVTELLTDTACKCDPDERDCKITTRINVMLPRIAGLGVWRLESHGYYAAAELPDQLDILQQISGGRMVSGLLRIEHRSNKKEGRTNRYPVPVLDLPNVTLGSLIGNQVVVNPPTALEAGKPPMLNGGALPADASFRDNQTPGFGERPALPSHEPTDGEMRERLLEVARAKGIDHAGLERYATEVGIPQGARATSEQLAALIALMSGNEQPLSGVPTAPADGEAEAARASVSPTTPPSDEDGSEAATVHPRSAPPLPDARAPTFEDVLRVSGGVEVPPAPGSAAYRALPTGVERAAAKAYWEAQPEQLRVPA